MGALVILFHDSPRPRLDAPGSQWETEISGFTTWLNPKQKSIISEPLHPSFYRREYLFIGRRLLRRD